MTMLRTCLSPRNTFSLQKSLPLMKKRQGKSTLRKPSSPASVIPLSASRRSLLRRKPLSVPSPIKIGDGFLPAPRWRAPQPARGVFSLYHTASLFVNRKNKQKSILLDPVICALLPLVFLLKSAIIIIVKRKAQRGK